MIGSVLKARYDRGRVNSRCSARLSLIRESVKDLLGKQMDAFCPQEQISPLSNVFASIAISTFRGRIRHLKSTIVAPAQASSADRIKVERITAASGFRSLSIEE